MNRIDQPQPGFYVYRRSAQHPRVACRIWWAAPIDPDTGEMLDRPPMLVAQRGGEWVDPHELWVSVAGREITKSEHDFLLADATWAKKNAPNDPAANPSKRIDLNAMPSLF